MELAVKRKRKYTPKVRTGCVTCKKRRVKCDEAKPHCQRCENSGYQCDGYVVPVTRLFEPSSTTSTPSAQIRIPSPLSIQYGSEEESSSLQFFVKRTGPMISMYSNVKDFWTVVIPRTSWSFPPVKHMLVAVSLTDRYLAGQLTTLEFRGEFVRAYHYYNKAIQGLTEGQPPMACVLLSCILAWVFETITNHFEAAGVHLRAATRMLAQCQSGAITLEAGENDLVNSSVSPIVHEANRPAEGSAVPEEERPPLEFETLCDARRYLEGILEFMTCEDMSLAWCMSQARHYLTTFVHAFEDYRYRGPEPLAQKRAVFIVYNSLRTLVQVEETVSNGSVDGKLWESILSDIEHVFEHEFSDLLELKRSLRLLLAAVIHYCSVKEQRERAVELRKKVR